jgi:WD40 repeat protein
MQLSPTGRLLATTSRDTTSRIWFVNGDGVDEKEKNVLNLDSDFTVEAASFSPDGTLLVTGDGLNRVNVWQVSSGMRLNFRTLTEGENVAFFISSLDFSPDGELLAASSTDGTIHLWGGMNDEYPRMELRWEKIPRDKAAVVAIAFIPPAGRYLVSASALGPVRIWNTETGEETLRLVPDDPLVGVEVTADGDMIIGYSGNGQLFFWDALTGDEIGVARASGSGRGLALSRDGRLLGLITGDGYSLWGIDPCSN